MVCLTAALRSDRNVRTLPFFFLLAVAFQEPSKKKTANSESQKNKNADPLIPIPSLSRNKEFSLIFSKSFQLYRSYCGFSLEVKNLFGFFPAGTGCSALVF